MSLSRVESSLVLGGENAVAARLARYGQEHLVRFWDELSEPQRRGLAEQIDSVDFALLEKLFRETSPTRPLADLAARAEPAPALRLNEVERGRTVEARRAGEAALAAGKIGVIVVAGGQGTRLGLSCAKGTAPVGPVSGRSLLQMLIDRIRAASRRYGAGIPLYVMTSPATHAQLSSFLDEHDRFGLPPQDLVLFQQGVMPAVCRESGKVLMAGPDALCLAPNGHGGVLEAIHATGALTDAALRGVEHFFYCQVDNPLAPCCDPDLIGLHLLTGSEMTTLAVAKSNPTERLGNIVTVDGRVQIVEYTELPPEIAARRHCDGSLRLWAGNTGIHVFDVRFLRRAAGDPDLLPYHRAEKTTACLDQAGRLVKPEVPNSIKFERFIFDLLPVARIATVIESQREEVFAPVKNGNGDSDTLESAQAAISALHRNWLAAVGIPAPSQYAVEINPLFALDAEELAARLPPGTRIAGPTYFA
jgi:UDP-N-acetylglucosamine/UDP-N-acetylgalactosamine diphosphorylase